MPGTDPSPMAVGSKRVQWFSFLSVMLLGCCALCASSPGSSGSKRGPTIINTNKTTDAELDKTLTLNCTAEFVKRKLRIQLIYWLVNGTFVEDQYPDGRVTEGKAQEIKSKTDTTVTLRKTLHFKSVKETDCELTFICVAQDPSGLDKKEIRLRKISSSTQDEKEKVAADTAEKFHGQ
uniref:Interleukin-1 receptor type 2-like isoform X2 n=1 Tax=Geotrypetes seraphini TaxID=260995 RepID=A0A6P8R087_GEOSA|nr:interleukin-1 receptor type 2-like isoform X2 [Geotrypetes seraphini]